MNMLHQTWLAALGVPSADAVRELREAQGQLEGTPADEYRRGRFTNFAASDVNGSGGDLTNQSSGGDLVNQGSIVDLNSCWKAVLKKDPTVDVYGVSFSLAVFLSIDNDQKFMDVSADQVGCDAVGNPILLSDDDDSADSSAAAAVLPFTPSSYTIKGVFQLWGSIPATMVSCLEVYSGPVFELVQPVLNVTLQRILTGIDDSCSGILLKDTVLTYQSKERGSTNPGIYLSSNIVPSGPLQPVVDFLKDVFGQEDPAIMVSGQLTKKRDWVNAPIPVELILRAQLLDLNIQLGGIIDITEMGVEVTGTRTPGSKEKSGENSDDEGEGESADAGNETEQSSDGEEESADDGNEKENSSDGEEDAADVEENEKDEVDKQISDGGNSKHKLTQQFVKADDDGKGDDKVDPKNVTYAFSAAVSGTAGITVPGSVLPLHVNWLLAEEDEAYTVTLDVGDEEWKDVLGIIGLTLKNVKFEVCFSKEKPDMAGLSLGILGSVCFGSTVITVDGAYDSKGNWMIVGDLEDLDVDITLLEQFYKDVFGTELSDDINSKEKLEFEKLQLLIKHDSETGSTLTFEGEVSLNGYTSVNATITLSSLGLEIKGDISNITFEEHFTIESASIDILINPKNASGTVPYRASISGIVKISDVEIKVGLYVDALADNPLWTVYGEIENLVLSDFGSAIKGTFLDLELLDVAVIASNRDQQQEDANKASDDPNRFNYPVKKGLQVWAKVAKVDAVSSVTRTKPVVLELCIAYEEGKSLTVDIVLPTKGKVNLSKSIYSGDITLEAVISNDPHISISAGLFVMVQTQQDPLELDFTLTAKEQTAEGLAAMLGMWNDPFGISPRVQVGNVLLGVEIIYEEFFETGIPKSITFGGDLKVGKTEGKLLLKVSENPEDELIVVDITDLDVADFIDFARDVTLQDIPQIPHTEALYLNTVHIEYAMANVTVNKQDYAQGLDLDCEAEVFGHNMTLKANIHKDTGIYILGFIQCFYLGPLEVSGSKKDTDAKLEIKIDEDTQKIYIDGGVSFSDKIYAAIFVDVELKPTPVFHFSTKLSFGQILQFDLEANMIGDIHGAETRDLDFELEAYFQQEILDFIDAKAEEYFKSFDQAAQADFDKRETELETEEKEAADGLKRATADLEKVLEHWDNKRKAVMKAYDDKQKEVDDKIDSLRKDVDDAQKALDKAVDACKNALTSVQNYWATAIKKAKSAIDSAAKEADQKLEAARRLISDAQAKLDSTFGDVNRAIDTAQTDVKNAQWYVDQKQKEVDAKQKEYDDCAWYESAALWIELKALKAKKLVLQAVLDLANKALDVAKAVLNDVVYKRLVKALSDAKTALDTLQTKLKKDAQTLKDDLDTAKKDGDTAIQTAKDELEYAKTKGVEVESFKKAQDALTTFKNGVDDFMKDVKYAVDHILETVEYIVYLDAKAAVKVWYELVNVTLKFKRAKLEADEKEEAAFSSILKALEKQGKVIFSVKEVKLSAELSSMWSDKALDANIDASVGGEDCTISLSYTIGDVESFLNDLWAKVKDELEDLFADLA